MVLALLYEHKYAVKVCIFASLCGFFFGYDQGVTGGVLIMNSFLEDFCDTLLPNPEDCRNTNISALPTAWLTFTTLFNVLYSVGCIFGAFLGGVICDRYGRRAAIFTASLFFIVGTVWVITMPAGQHTLVRSP